eukprot:1196229-Prorocentrum_minimum.AAC.8
MDVISDGTMLITRIVDFLSPRYVNKVCVSPRLSKPLLLREWLRRVGSRHRVFAQLKIFFYQKMLIHAKNKSEFVHARQSSRNKVISGYLTRHNAFRHVLTHVLINVRVAVSAIGYYRYKKIALDGLLKREHEELVKKTKELEREHKELELERKNHDFDKLKKELEAVQRSAQWTM